MGRIWHIYVLLYLGSLPQFAQNAQAFAKAELSWAFACTLRSSRFKQQRLNFFACDFAVLGILIKTTEEGSPFYKLRISLGDSLNRVLDLIN